ncbi:Oligogalacturonate-specific porin protein (KdgM) [Franzmannia pantelleriensis]|uniref:Oligogalacturonate-specific porin protein (KdgM) n=1 Tax=Franzmannia pantelleriensis TaxID=48727 RepID=A0A1G9R1D8_9GAMM|nr:oligogalacturonate-specific porin KdgM family protein [Halomonas pantelleriensis]SDM16951.1 Oligogalacturonate-specific porin protein (KdgM) [Halomonas pantelleriensis]
MKYKKQFAATVVGAALFLSSMGSVWATSNNITIKLEHTTNDHSLTLPKAAYTRSFSDGSSLMFEKSWFWQEGNHTSGWPKHDEGFVNYTLPSYRFGQDSRWSLAPQLGAKFRSNLTRALAGLRLGYAGDGWSLATRYRYEHDTNHETAERAQVGRIDLFASYEISDRWSILYNPHYHFKQENRSPDFANGKRDFIEHELLAFYQLSEQSTVFGGHVWRAKNSESAAVDPNQRLNSFIIGYSFNF